MNAWIAFFVAFAAATYDVCSVVVFVVVVLFPIHEFKLLVNYPLIKSIYTRGHERDPAREDEWIIALACDIIKFIICAKAGCPAKLRICFPALSLFLPFGRYEKRTIKNKLSQIDCFVYHLQSKQ